MGYENLSRPAVIVRPDGSTLLKLADEFCGALIADAEVIAQHHGRYGMAMGQELQGILVEWVTAWQWWRQNGDLFGSNIHGTCRRSRGVKTLAAVGAKVGARAGLMAAVGTVDGA
jgi:hypothetical protein